MALRGRKPEAVQKRLKALFYGAAGVGKTTASIQFPKPYLIDCERGAENDSYVKLLDAAGGAYFATTDFDEMVREVTALMTEKHEYRTVIIDPMTVPYGDMLDKNAQRLARASTDPNSDGTEFGRHKKEPDRQARHLLNLLLRLDMNVIVTCHSKPKWERIGKEVREVGQTFDGYGKLDYLFDLVFEVRREGQEIVGVVRKSRIAAFPFQDEFPFTYVEIAKRYGGGILERKAEAVTLASAKQVAELTRLVDILRVPPETVEKWLDKAGADSFAEMAADAADKCVQFLENKFNTRRTEPVER